MRYACGGPTSSPRLLARPASRDGCPWCATYVRHSPGLSTPFSSRGLSSVPAGIYGWSPAAFGYAVRTSGAPTGCAAPPNVLLSRSSLPLYCSSENLGTGCKPPDNLRRTRKWNDCRANLKQIQICRSPAFFVVIDNALLQMRIPDCSYVLVGDHAGINRRGFVSGRINN